MFISDWDLPIWPPSIQMGETAGIFLASILLRDAPSSVYKISTTPALSHALWFAKSYLELNHRIRRYTEGPLRVQRVARRRSSQPVQRVYWPFCWLTCIYLAGVMADSMRNAICAETQTSKVPTRVALLYISLFCELGADYMEQFQPGLSFSPDDRAEVSARSCYKILMKQSTRLHDKNFQPGLSFSPVWATRAETSARAEIQLAIKILTFNRFSPGWTRPCNRRVFFSPVIRAETQPGLKLLHVIGP